MDKTWSIKIQWDNKLPEEAMWVTLTEPEELQDGGDDTTLSSDSTNQEQEHLLKQAVIPSNALQASEIEVTKPSAGSNRTWTWTSCLPQHLNDYQLQKQNHISK